MSTANLLRVECRDRTDRPPLRYLANPPRVSEILCAGCGETVPVKGDELHTVERRVR